MTSWTLADEIGAMDFIESILTAIVAKERTGKGQKLVTSQTGGMVRFRHGPLPDQFAQTMTRRHRY